MEAISKITVVGGPRSVASRMEQRLSEHGVKILDHVGELEAGKNKPMASLPAGTEGVVVMVDSCGHMLYDHAKVLARKAGVPFIMIPRKWAQAEPVLRAQGVLPPATNGDAKIPKPEVVEEMSLSYVCEEREKGRVPKIEEVNAMLQRAFGPKVALDGSRYGEVTSKAAARVPLAPETKKETVTRQTEEVRQWVRALIEEDPERILNVNLLIQKVRKDLKNLDKSVDVSLAVRMTATKVRTRFRSLLSSDQAWRNPIIRRWLESKFREAIEGRKPPYRVPGKPVFDRSKEIFGVGVAQFFIVEARARVLGEWARVVLRNKKAYAYYKSTYPKGCLTEAEFEGLLSDGTIPSFYTGNQWFTSKLAIDEYVDLEKPKGDVVVDPRAVNPRSRLQVVRTEVDNSKSVPKTPDFSDPMVFKPVVESVVLEVMTMLEGVVAKAVGKALEPITQQVNGLEASIEEAQKAVDGKTADIGNSNAKAFKAISDNVFHLNNRIGEMAGNSVAKVDDQTKKVNGLFGMMGTLKDAHDTDAKREWDALCEIADRQNAILEGQAALIRTLEVLNAAKVPSATTGADMLASLANLHATTGLEFTIGTPAKGEKGETTR